VITSSYTRSMSLKTLGLLAFLAFAVGALATHADAAVTPSPGLKVLAVSSPTHIPPRQSEVQRLTVEAEGGTFQVGAKAGDGKISPAFRVGLVSSTIGSNVSTVSEGGEALEVGARVVAGGYPFQGTEVFVVSCSPDCTTPGSSVTFSSPAVETVTNETIIIQPKEATVVEGSFAVGDELRDEGESHNFLPGTDVTAVNGLQISLSKPPAEGCFACENVGVAIIENTAPLAYDAAPAAVQSALQAVPVLGSGSVTVTGGPGGDAEHPYFLAFGGKFSDEDVERVVVNESELFGPHKQTNVFTTIPGGNGTGELDVLPANIGALPTSGNYTAKVGPLPAGVVTSGEAQGVEWKCSGGAGESTVTCVSNEPLRPLHSTPHTIGIPVEVQTGAPLEAEVPVELSGGGAPRASTYELDIVVSKEPAPFGIAAAWAGSFEADGSPATQAGGHPYDSAAYFMVNSKRLGNGGLSPGGDSKNIVVDLPPGFVGNPLAGPRCPQSQVLAPEVTESPLCNNKETVGNLDPLIGDPTGSLPFESRLYNDMPPRGVAAEFTTRVAFPLQSVLASINSEEDFGIKLTAPNNPNIDKIYGAFTAFEGVPKEGNGQALLTNPTNCAESREKAPVVRTSSSTFQEPDRFPEFILPQPVLVGCENLQFTGVTPQNPGGQVAFSFTPSANEQQVSTGSTPVGAIAHLHINQPGLIDSKGLATPELKRSVIKLPEGMSLNPSSANGLEGCSEAQIGYLGSGFPTPSPMRFSEAQPTCPTGSKLGTAEIKTPLLDNPLAGEVFLANQDENPYGSLLAIYLVVNDPYTGVLIKLPGEVRPDPQTGRLTTTLDNNPQLPFDDLILKFRGGGARSEFATSEVCGNFPTEGEWTPWSAPESGPPAQTSDSFDVSSNCASSPGARPFAPSFEAGTTANNAGGYNPLVIKIGRKDGEQELTSLNFTLPKGLIGKLAGIPYCGDDAIAAAEHKSGKDEQSNPSCPAASQVGTVDTSAGVGSEPFHVGGKLYLAGPYKGAPVSSVVITPALAGPFDLGNVVVRAPLYIDHETAELTAKSDAIPTILRGIPLKVRSVDINVDRPGFIVNPTNCKPMTAAGSFGGGSGATAKASTRFQVAGCKNLQFAPKLKIQLKGKTKRAGNPALTAILTQPLGQANIGSVSVALPHSEFLEQGHIRTNCTRVQFAAEQCPKGSIYGHAEAISPLLDQPLTGPVYLRSSNHKLPDLVAALKGPASQPIEIDLDGRIDSIHGGIRTTFETVPDAPVSKFVLRMQGGKKSLLVNSTNICKGKHKARVEMVGQNGKEHNFSQLVEPKCGKKSNGKKKSGKKSKGGKR
jgi:hypothetical protein